jgi:hypothetical protein
MASTAATSRVPRANSPEESVEIGAGWRRPQYGSSSPEADLTDVYAAAWHCLENNSPASWLSPDAATAAPPRR